MPSSSAMLALLVTDVMYLVPRQIQKLQAARLPGCGQYTRASFHPLPSKLQLAAFPFDPRRPIASLYDRVTWNPANGSVSVAEGSDTLQQMWINVTQPKLVG